MISHFDLTLPPSVNDIWTPVGSRMVRSKAYRAWLTSAGWELQAARQASIAGRYNLTVYLPEAMPGDIDNRCKALSDVLEAHRIIENDRLCWSLIVHRMPDIAKGRCSVFITSVSAPEAVAA